MKKTKKLLSLLTALAITASSFAAMVIPASAATPIEGASYNFEDGNPWAASGLHQQIVVNVVDDQTLSSKVLNIAVSSAGGGGRTATLAIPATITPSADGIVQLDFKFYCFTGGGTGNNYSATFRDSSDKDIFSVGDVNGTGFMFNGKNVAGLDVKNWHDVSIVMDFETHKIISASFTKHGEDKPAAAVYDVDFLSADAADISKVYCTGGRDGSSNASINLSLDDVVASDATEDYFTATITVKDTNETAVADAKVKIGDAEFTTDAEGKVTAKLEKGEHEFTVSKIGFVDEEGNETATGTVSDSDASVEVTYSLKPYTPEVKTVDLGGGQKQITAPESEASVAAEPFTVAVQDQNEVDMTSDKYTVDWKVYKTGTTTADENVTISDDGVVSVKKEFNAGENKDAAVYDVVATVTDVGNTEKVVTAKTTVTVLNADVKLYDVETSYTATGATSKDYPIGNIAIPEGGLRIGFTYYKGKYDSTSASANGQLLFKSGDTTLFYMKDMNSGLTIYTDDDHSADLGTTLRDTPYPTEITILGQLLIVSFNGADNVVLEFNDTPTNITNITATTNQNGGSGTGATDLVMSTKINVDKKAAKITGDDKVAKVKGKSVTRDYAVKAYVPEAGDSFTWSMTPESAGVTLTPEGELTVTENATPGKVKLTAVSGEGDEQKKGEIEVEIADFQKLTLTADGPKAYNLKVGDKGQYKLISALDSCGDDMVELDTMPELKWSSSNAEVATIAEDTGELTLVGKGKTTVKATVTNDAQISEYEIPVVVDNYYITKDVAADTASMDIDVSDLYKSDSITGYLVTTSKDGKLINQEEATGKAVTIYKAAEAGTLIKATYNAGTLSAVEASAVAVDDVIPDSTQTVKYFAWDSLAGMKPIKTTSTLVGQDGHIVADTTGADKVEVAPIFETKMNVENIVPADRYNVTVTANNGRRTDVYVNDQMVINNVNQDSGDFTVGRAIAASTDYTAEDVVIGEGYATFKYMDDQSSASTITGVKFVKAPSIVTRAKRVYVIGDSLVAKYYGTAPEGQEGLVRTGWGDVLQDYMADGIKVTNLGNSGAIARGMYYDAFTNVRGSAQLGDIVVWESGYNDSNPKNNTSVEEMTDVITKAADESIEKGCTFYLVNPNASSHDYNDSVQWAAHIRTIAESLATKHGADKVKLIDLSKLSYEFLSEKYGELQGGSKPTTEQTAANNKIHTLLRAVYNNTGDTLHSTYNAANCWAAIVADALPAEVTNTTHTYTFSDGTGELSKGDITVGVGLMPTLEAASGSGE